MGQGRVRAFGLMIGLLAVLGGTAQAVPLTVGGGWQDFIWGEDLDAWNDEGAFTYVADSWTSLKVTDIRVDSDRFEVYDGDIPIGTTSVPANSGAETDDYDLAYGNPLWSSGEFLLAPGAHAVTLLTILDPIGVGRGALRADIVPIPAPGAILLGTFGLGLFGWLRQRKSL